VWCVFGLLQSPEEFPLKLGAWKQLPKLTREAVKEAKGRGTGTEEKKEGFMHFFKKVQSPFMAL
jgi:hypothetical protein